MESKSEVIRIIDALREGDPWASAKLLPLVPHKWRAISEV
jgi:hypothetical protein